MQHKQQKKNKRVSSKRDQELAATAAAAPSYYRTRLAVLDTENKKLKNTVQRLDRENRDLKKSLYELNRFYVSTMGQRDHTTNTLNDAGIRSKSLDFDLSSALATFDGSKDRSRNASLIETETSKKTKGGSFHRSYNLLGHTGPVYVAKFSPDGKFLASGSFDKTVRIWDTATKREVYILSDHKLNISDVCWSNDCKQLISGSYDRHINLWNTDVGKCVRTFDADSMVQAVQFIPESDTIFYVAVTHKRILGFDTRTGQCIQVFESNSMINTICFNRKGSTIVSGDNNGMLRIWDIKTGLMRKEYINGECKPISHVHISKCDADDDGYVGVNSFDNVIRVYHEDDIFNETKESKELHVVHRLKSHRNKHWPIKSSFYSGKEFHSTKRLPSPASMDYITTKDPELTLLLATGSAEPITHVYDLGRHSYVAKAADITSTRLNSHSDRVNAVDFHPNKPILASCSADNSISIWSWYNE